jgi:uncharacterized protein YbjT (DUF2867 family)
MRKMLVLGGTGLVGRRLTRALLDEGFAVRCSVRNPDAARAKLPSTVELVQGDLADRGSMEDAVHSVDAVFDCVHTLSAQDNGSPNESFVDTELRGLGYLVTACRAHRVRRILYLTFLGLSPDATTEWGRGRWKAEQLLLDSGLDATILRPGQIVGKGGHGFDLMMAQARRRFAVVLGGGRQRMQNIALDDLVHYLVHSLDEPRTFGKAFDVGCDDILTGDEMIDVAARVLGKRAPLKLHLHGFLLLPIAALVERAARLSKGAFRDLLVGMRSDLVGDVLPLREIIRHTPLDYQSAIERTLQA